MNIKLIVIIIGILLISGCFQEKYPYDCLRGIARVHCIDLQKGNSIYFNLAEYDTFYCLNTTTYIISGGYNFTKDEMIKCDGEYWYNKSKEN